MNPDDPTLDNTVSQVPAVPARAGKYRITGQIGKGGMGVVYRAVDDVLGRTVALKFLPPDVEHHSSLEQRFLREARAASALDHVNIGTIFGVDETSAGRRFIVMAYYEGQSLSERLRDKKSPVSPGEAITIAIQVARGLADAHAHSVIHRDIKPSNILLTGQGVVKIVDFGLARMANADQLTMTGAAMGTPAYMSPEQALGQPTDHRSDIWSLGVVLLEMLTRQQVFQGDSIPGVLYKIVHGELPTLERVQQPLRSILASALEKDPAKRYQSVNEFLAALEALPPGTLTILEPVYGRPMASSSPARFHGLRWGWKLVLAAVLLLAALAGITAYVRNGIGAGTKKPPVAGAPASQSVFDKYMRGVELMRRWDKAGNLEQATTLFQEGTSSDPTFALGFARLAEAQRIRYTLSRDKAALEAATKSAQEAMRLNPELAPVQVAWGRIQAARGNSDLAMASFNRAVLIDPNDSDAQLAIGRQYERLGRLADAEAAFKKAITLDPDNNTAHDSYANFLFRQSRYEDAVHEWQIVIRTAPDNAAAYVNLGSSLSESGRIAEAVTMYQKAVELKPTGMAYSNLGTAYSRTGHYAEAVTAFRRSIELDSNNSMVWGNLAQVQSWMKGMEVQARQSFQRAIELAEQGRKDNPRDPFVHSDLALYYAKAGNAPLATQRIETALALSPKGPITQITAAEVYELLGQRAKALAFARKALSLGYARQRIQSNPELVKLLPSLD